MAHPGYNIPLILGGGYCGMVKHVRLHAIYAENPLASFTEIWSCMSGKAAWDHRLDRGSTTNRTYLAIHDGNAFATMGALVGTSLNELYLSVAVRAETLATFVSMAPCLERLTATNILAATFPVEDHTRFAAGPSNLMRLKPLSTTMKALTIRQIQFVPPL
ncbi:hypothetical protein H4R18_005270 [Coemansia javaensis]|uniref:Uncharacterized protein n=1 Tax=Coemansia javaensis TaxID=2761396 RepID=A0A9W8H9Q2_9FUNG|nr:hypothetical protein H4R18_005270 [Coemansia javaensis]